MEDTGALNTEPNSRSSWCKLRTDFNSNDDGDFSDYSDTNMYENCGPDAFSIDMFVNSNSSKNKWRSTRWKSKYNTT